MANMNRKRTKGVRSPEEWSNILKEIQSKKLKEQKRFVSTARIMEGVMNQYKKYPKLLKELEGAEFK